ncbi:MAG: thioredoxin domain-containing protein [Bacteroides sp.]|nr:thioredoxin domain-containing protein [Roseburia sp.]MCM1346567.1 thioredoxin domain-containing protein [Bacteroides sp.]MCM1420555.1 thioredoxin domain-containing protein [Bacteroides sp.]
MKRNTLLYGILMCASSIMAQSEQGFTIKGSLQGLPDSLKVKLIDTENEEEYKTIAEANISNGSFTLEGSVPNTRLCELVFTRKNKQSGYDFSPIRIRIPIENVPVTISSEVTYDSIVKADYSQKQEMLLKAEGGKVLSEFNEYTKAINDIELKAKKARYKSASKYFETNDNPDTMKIYRALEEDAQKRLDEANMRFIKSHPNHFISAYLVNKKLETFFEYTTDELNDMATIVASYPDTARNNRINKYLTRALKYARMMNVKDFEAQTPDNDTLLISTLITPGKYCLIDFWASWCGPCRASIPKIKSLYEKFNEKFNVISVSVDEKESAWRKAMDSEKMPWHQLWVDDTKAVKACTAYAVQSIPRLVLIDDKGHIVIVTHDPNKISEQLKTGLGY